MARRPQPTSERAGYETVRVVAARDADAENQGGELKISDGRHTCRVLVPQSVDAGQPLESTVMSVKRAIGPDAPGEICHVALQTGGRLPYVEGQSIGVLPPGTDPKTSKPHQQRLYSIASTRYGDDGAGDSVSLCVRRAVYVDPETGKEDPAKKGVCSNFLCDATAGEQVKMTGPTGKVMLMPEEKADTDLSLIHI